MSEVAAAMGRTTQQLSTARQRLIDKGIIESRGFNTIGFTMPGFERFVAAKQLGGTERDPQTP